MILVSAILSAIALAAAGQEASPAAETETPAQAASPEAAEAAPAQAPSGPAAQPQAQGQAAQGAQDALVLFRRGRDLETAGRSSEAQAAFAQSVAVCDRELAADPGRIEAYVVRGWSLFRLGRHAEVISNGQTGLKVAFDARIVEVMGESYYYLGRIDDSLKSLQKYIEIVGDSGDRGATAYFFMAEAYLKLGKYSHADIAYSTAVRLEPSMPRWWFRLGEACERLGDWKRAYDAYSRALSLSPSYREALEAQARVKPKLP